MSQDAFVKLEKKELKSVLESVNPLVEGGAFDAETVTVLAQDLSFYPGCRFLDVADFSTVPAFQRHVVYGGKQTVVLDGTSVPIYRLNREVPVKLNEKNVVDYIRFFFNNVRGKHGRFLITESVEDIAWREEPPPAARKAVGQLLEPVEIVSVRDGTYVTVARMLFKEALFKATVTVQPDGTVTITDEELLIEDIPVLDDTFGQ